MQRSVHRNLVVAALLMVAIIIYGSLYDFTPRPASDLSADGPVLFLLRTWKLPPSGRGDLIANILLYMPYGFFAALAISSNVAVRKRLLWVSLGGLVLCTAMELTQFYIVGRVTNMSDVYLNTFGSFLGAVGGVLLGTDFRWPLLKEFSVRPFPALLLAAWLGYRMYPYVPTIDLHKYWHAVRPALALADMQIFDLVRFTIIWLFLSYLTESVFGARRFPLIFLLIVAIEFTGKIFILDNYLKPADMLGAAFGFALWHFLRRGRRPAAIVAGLMVTLVILLRLEPFEFYPSAHRFGWIPFLGFMRGSLSVDIQSFLEKFFLYGAAIWILAEAGMALVGAAILVSAALFATSLLETYMPRSAELTDAVMAVAIAIIYRLLPDRTPQGGTGYAWLAPRSAAHSPAAGVVRSIPAKATQAPP